MTKMKAFAILIAVAIIIALVWGINLMVTVITRTPTPAEIAQNEVRAALFIERQESAYTDRTVRNMEFFQEPRTGICFARSGSYHDAVLTTVDCDKVPTTLLQHPKLPEKN